MSKRGIPGQGLNQITQQQATFQALDELGDRTSLAVLKERAEQIYGRPISSVMHHKTYWRMVNNVTNDCRTYAGQPRRNMLKDTVVPPKLQNRLDETLDDNTRLGLIAFLNRFHSKEQLMTALRRKPAKKKKKQLV